MSSELFEVKEHIIPAQHIRGFFKSTANSEEEELALAVKQYIPRANRGDVTIIAAHAAGFCKELYEPLFDDIFHQAGGECTIRSIWIADICTHGQSGVLNEGRLGIDLTWEEHARDLLHMTNVFRKEIPKPIIGLGHSMGANNITQLALYHPRLFSGIICIEPVLNRTHKGMNFSPSYWLTEREDVWASKDEAVAKSRKSGLMKTWDSRVVDRFQDFGLRDLPTLLHREAPQHIACRARQENTTPVTFATTKHHDVRAFVRDCHPSAGEPLNNFEPSYLTHPDISKEGHADHGQPVYRGDAVLLFQQISFLRPACLYTYGERSTLFGSRPVGRAEKFSLTGTGPGGGGGAKAGQISEVVLEGAGHFAALERSAKVAEVVCDWMEPKLRRWQEDTASQARSWNRFSVREKAMVSEDWRWWVKEAYARKTESDVAAKANESSQCKL